MTALITGANGTVGAVLRDELRARGHTAIPWDRTLAPPDDPAGPARLIAEYAPDVLYHLAIASRSTGRPNEGWLVNVEWSQRLAAAARDAGIAFVFASTVMVFSDRARGPFTPDSQPDADQGYGYEKRMAEEHVRAANPGARIVRLGWQVGRIPSDPSPDRQGGASARPRSDRADAASDPNPDRKGGASAAPRTSAAQPSATDSPPPVSAGTNTMLHWLHNQQAQHGRVALSRKWLPACAFLEDTADALIRAAHLPPATYHADANPDWSHFEIASALNHLQARPWTIVPDDAFVYDQRMQDDRLPLQSIDFRI